MKVLIVYGTTEGQTRKIVQFIRDRFQQGGHDVTVHEAIDRATPPDPTAFDAVVVAASVHVGRYQAAVEDYVRRNLEAFRRVPTTFVSVSLAAAGHDEDDVAGLAHVVAEFERHTGWTPDRVVHVAGAFLYTQYDFFKRWALKYIAWRKGAPTDTSRDYELTDWDALARLVDEVSAPASRPAA